MIISNLLKSRYHGLEYYLKENQIKKENIQNLYFLTCIDETLRKVTRENDDKIFIFVLHSTVLTLRLERGMDLEIQANLGDLRNVNILITL